jgi:alpha-L-fucosidase
VNLGPKRDLIAECLEAARAAGLRVGLYYSPSEPFAHQDPRYLGDDPPLADRHAFTAACREKPEYAERYRKRIYSEIEEYLTRYGKIDVWWHDGPLPPEILPPAETLALFRRLQPEMLVNDRVIGRSNEMMGDFATQDYNESPIHGQKIGEPGRDWETGMPINGSWSWVPESIHDTLRPRDILHRLYTCVSEQGNLLISVAPKGDGTVDDAARQSIDRVGEWVKDHAEAVYGRFERPRHRYNQAGQIITYLSPGISKCANWALKDERTAYLWVQWWPGANWPIGNFPHTVKKVTLVRDGSAVEFQQDGSRVNFKNLPQTSPDTICRYNILKIDFEPNPELF